MDEMRRDLMDPFPWYARMRSENPVYYDPEYKLVNVFRYKDVKETLGNFNNFSSQFGKAFNPAGGPISESIINLDPPKHTKLRNIVSKAFTPRTIEKMAPQIREIADNLLNSKKGHEVDIIKGFTSPLPITVIATMLGIPLKDMDKFKKWSDIIIGGSERSFTDFPKTIEDMTRYFQNLMIEKENNPDQSLVYSVLNAEVDGEKLTMMESLGFFILLLVAGNETTTNLISNALLTFNEYHGTYDAIRGDSKLIPQALEEVLRYRSPVQSIYRVARVDTELSGVPVRKGSIMVPWIGSANRDESVFEDADKFMMERKDNRHIAFGEGIHYCLGAPLARLEAKIAMECMTENFESYEILRDRKMIPQESTIVYGFRELWVKLN
ncbi:MAG: cytochrome P450 [Candidatus Thermoplasmatota archaeon]|jgi:cytochrome P450|nr:cytochrome P450 [Candidatus Thermoplasmatota archaeon]